MWSIELIFFIGSLMLVSVIIGILIGYLSSKKLKQKQLKKTIEDVANKSSLEETILQTMESLKNQLKADFIGLAIYDVITEEIRWRLTTGSISTRFKRIVIRMGKGVAGEAILLNRTIRIQNFPEDVLGDPIEYPILMVEHLKSVMALPVSDEKKIYGVILVGQRQIRSFTSDEEASAAKASIRIAHLLESATITKDFSRQEVIPSKVLQINLTDLPLIKFLQNQQKEMKSFSQGNLEFEILDQSILSVSEKSQETLIEVLKDYLMIVGQEQNPDVFISILKDVNYLLIECKSIRLVSFTQAHFGPIYEKIGKLGGSIQSYQEEDLYHLTLQIPVSSY